MVVNPVSMKMDNARITELIHRIKPLVSPVAQK
jgi:ATP phosphoribosyltransferase